MIAILNRYIYLHLSDVLNPHYRSEYVILGRYESAPPINLLIWAQEKSMKSSNPQ